MSERVNVKGTLKKKQLNLKEKKKKCGTPRVEKNVDTRPQNEADNRKKKKYNDTDKPQNEEKMFDTMTQNEEGDNKNKELNSKDKQRVKKKKKKKKCSTQASEKKKFDTRPLMNQKNREEGMKRERRYLFIV